METEKTLDGWQFMGTVTAWSGRSGWRHELYGRELFGKVRYRLVDKDDGFDALVRKNTGNNPSYSEYSHEACGRYFNFDE